jgi:hypothetical protein
MTQIATILRKDFERLWPVCLIVIALMGLHFYEITRNGVNAAVAINGPLSILFLVMSLSGTLLPVALVVILVLLIQEEPLVGSNAFWLTRPYSRTATNGGKGFVYGPCRNRSDDHSRFACAPLVWHGLLRRDAGHRHGRP